MALPEKLDYHTYHLGIPRAAGKVQQGKAATHAVH
jgi:hypothetical protein